MPYDLTEKICVGLGKRTHLPLPAALPPASAGRDGWIAGLARSALMELV